jgi:TPR repeat protein
VTKLATEEKRQANPLRRALGLIALGNFAAARAILAPLAEQGDRTAQYHLARLYREGRGVLNNDIVALKWMRNAAWQGQSEAQIALAQMYARGVNGVRDHFLAYTWFLVAENNGAYQIAQRDTAEGHLQPEQVPQASALATQIADRQSQSATDEHSQD